MKKTIALLTLIVLSVTIISCGKSKAEKKFDQQMKEIKEKRQKIDREYDLKTKVYGEVEKK
jgi:hypothetical protein